MAQDSQHRHVIDTQCTACSQELDIVMGLSFFPGRLRGRSFGGNLPFDISAHPAVRHTVARRLLDRMEADARPIAAPLLDVVDRWNCWNPLGAAGTRWKPHPHGIPFSNRLFGEIRGVRRWSVSQRCRRRLRRPKWRSWVRWAVLKRFGFSWISLDHSIYITTQYLFQRKGLIQKLDGYGWIVQSRASLCS